MVHSDLPLARVARILGGKWKLIVLWHLKTDRKRFSELQRLVSGIPPRSLSLHLKELERDGLVHREVFAEVPPRVEYSLTETGESLRPLLNMLNMWGQQYVKAREQ